MKGLQLLLNKVFVILLMIVLLPSCGSRDVFNQYVTFPDNNWHFDSVSRFDVNVKDTSLNYNVFVNIRHTEAYPYLNLWLFLEKTHTNGQKERDTIGVEVADIYGKWMGSGSTSLIQLAVPLHQNIKFTEPGEYSFVLRHGMRDTLLTGIKNIGIRIEKMN